MSLLLGVKSTDLENIILLCNLSKSNYNINKYMFLFVTFVELFDFLGCLTVICILVCFIFVTGTAASIIGKSD